MFALVDCWLLRWQWCVTWLMLLQMLVNVLVCVCVWRCDWAEWTSEWPDSCWRCVVGSSLTNCSCTVNITVTSSSPPPWTPTTFHCRPTSISTLTVHSCWPSATYCAVASLAHTYSDHDDSLSSRHVVLLLLLYYYYTTRAFYSPRATTRRNCIMH